MAEYINRQTLIDRINGTGYAEQIKSNLLFIARTIPAAAVRPAETGVWLELDDCMAICSECNNLGCGSDYCPCCGAKMEVTA